MNSVISSILPSVPSSTFNQLAVPVFRLTGKCVVPQSLVGDSKLIVALRSDVEPNLAVSTTNQSLVFSGVVFQRLATTNDWQIYSEFCGPHFASGSCSLKRLLIGSGLVFQRSTSDMNSMVEEWTFRSLPPTQSPVLFNRKVQSIFQDMYVKKNANEIDNLRNKYLDEANQIRNDIF